MKRTLIEASGNGPQIVLADADLAAAAAAAWRAPLPRGAGCVATERVLVEEQAHDEFVELVLARAGEVVLGHPLEDATTMGPLNNEPVAGRWTGHRRADDRGGQVLAGGRRADGFPTDLYYEMTVVDACRPTRSSSARSRSGRSSRSQPFAPTTRRSRWPTTPTSAFRLPSSRPACGGRSASSTRCGPAASR